MKKPQKGYVALITILIISALLMGVLMSIPLITADNLKSTLALKRGIQVGEIAKSCAEIGIIQTQRDEHYVGETLSISGGSCIIEVTAIEDGKEIVVSAELNGYEKGFIIQTEALGRSVSIKSWELQ